jgi:aminoglycoside/choline kinase family phosphotransferase
MNLPPGEWTALAADASTRRYWRGTCEGRPALLADFGADTDGLDRFVHVQALLSRNGLAVPAVYARPEGGAFLIQEFVEGWPLSKRAWSLDLRAELLSMASRIAAIAEWGEGPELLELDEARLRFELAFFRLHFLEGFLNVQSPSGLHEALDLLAAEVAAYPQRLAHRDFHTENFLGCKDRGIVVVDFQDALTAPRCYDAASLAVDPYREQSSGIAEGILSGWLELCGASAEEFRKTALQRALKALGTFGFQVTRRKRVRYVRFIRPQALSVLDLLPVAGASLECLVPHLRAAADCR